MTTPSSPVDSIAKAIEGVTHAPGPWVSEDAAVYCDDATGQRVADCKGEYLFWSKEKIRANADYIAACNPVAMREVLNLARQAEAMKQEMADLREVRATGRDAAGALHDALMAERTANAELREAMKPFAAVADVYDGTAVEDSDPILSTDGPRLTAGDVRRARALIGGGNAEN